MTRILLTTLVALVAPVLVVAQPVQWPVSQGGNGHWYEPIAVPGGITWASAHQAAQSAGGHLATLTSSLENDFVFNLSNQPQFWSGSFGPCIGGTQPSGSPEPAGGWQWVTGEAFSYSNWLPGQPDNGVPYGDEDSIHFWQGNGWNDEESTTIRWSYVIEYSLSEYQVNSSAANMAIDTTQGTASSPAVATVVANTPATLLLGSTNMGFLWDLGYGIAPLVPASGGGFTTAGGQILNLDLTDPTFGVLWNYFNSPGFVNATIPFSVPNPAAISIQMLVVAPTLLDGVAISQPTRLIVQ